MHRFTVLKIVRFTKKENTTSILFYRKLFENGLILNACGGSHGIQRKLSTFQNSTEKKRTQHSMNIRNDHCSQNDSCTNLSYSEVEIGIGQRN